MAVMQKAGYIQVKPGRFLHNNVRRAQNAIEKQIPKVTVNTASTGGTITQLLQPPPVRSPIAPATPAIQGNGIDAIKKMTFGKKRPGIKITL